MINLVTSFYKSGNNERDLEIETCLKKNYTNKFIDKIYLLNDKIYNLDFIDDKFKDIFERSAFLSECKEFDIDNPNHYEKID